MEKKQQKRPQREQINYIAVFGGGYILYTAGQLFQRLLEGSAEKPALNIGGGIFFAVAGIILIYREWNVYCYGKKKEKAQNSEEEP